MLKWAAVFFIISIIAGLLGFTNIAGGAMDIAKILFGIFLIFALILLICGLFFFGAKT
jgi:uncharacterized membrane protein YtjA (UPF0391 family)